MSIPEEVWAPKTTDDTCSKRAYCAHTYASQGGNQLRPLLLTYTVLPPLLHKNVQGDDAM